MKPPHIPKLTNILTSLPNKLTLGRVAAIPFLLLLYPFNVSFINMFCAFIFAVAALTDFFDGFLARHFKMETRVGAALDHIADKLLVTASLILLTNAQQLPAFLAALLICREIGVSGIRLAAKEQNLDINVNTYGKIKTAVQDVAIFCLLTAHPALRDMGMALMWISLFVSYYSGYHYWHHFWQAHKEPEAPVDHA